MHPKMLKFLTKKGISQMFATLKTAFNFHFLVAIFTLQQIFILKSA
jgi:hypothetical protein